MVQRHGLAPPSRSLFRHGWINRRKPLSFWFAQRGDQDPARVSISAAAVSIVGGDAIRRGWRMLCPVARRAGVDLWCQERRRTFYQCLTGGECIFITNVLDGDFFTHRVSRWIGRRTAGKGKNVER